MLNQPRFETRHSGLEPRGPARCRRAAVSGDPGSQPQVILCPGDLATSEDISACPRWVGAHLNLLLCTGKSHNKELSDPVFRVPRSGSQPPAVLWVLSLHCAVGGRTA